MWLLLATLTGYIVENSKRLGKAYFLDEEKRLNMFNFTVKAGTATAWEKETFCSSLEQWRTCLEEEAAPIKGSNFVKKQTY